MKVSHAIAATIVVFTMSAGMAIAGPCEDGVVKIDEALKSEELAADIRAQATDLRNQAEKLCAAGNEEEGLSVVSEAKALLAIE